MDFFSDNLIEIGIGFALAVYLYRAISNHKTIDQKMEEWIYDPDNDPMAVHLAKQTQRKRKDFVNDNSYNLKANSQVVWRSDYYDFVFFNGVSPHLEIIDFRTGKAFSTVGQGCEFGDINVSDVETAIRSGLDILQSQGIEITYGDLTDEQLGCRFGEYGSRAKYLDPHLKKK